MRTVQIFIREAGGSKLARPVAKGVEWSEPIVAGILLKASGSLRGFSAQICIVHHSGDNFFSFFSFLTKSIKINVDILKLYPECQWRPHKGIIFSEF